MAVHIHTGATKAKNEISGRKSRGLVRAVGGVLEHPDLTAASQLPVSSLSHVPKRGLSVEAVMDLESEILWPEHRREQPVEIDGVDASRAQEYSLLAMLLSRSPDATTLGRIAKLRGDTTSLGLAHVALAQAAGSANAERISREYFTLFGLTPERMRRAAPDAIVMHPGPMNRGVEIDSDVADGPFSVILEQVANGVAVRMAVLYLLSGRDADGGLDEH